MGGAAGGQSGRRARAGRGVAERTGRLSRGETLYSDDDGGAGDEDEEMDEEDKAFIVDDDDDDDDGEVSSESDDEDGGCGGVSELEMDSDMEDLMGGISSRKPKRNDEKTARKKRKRVAAPRRIVDSDED